MWELEKTYVQKEPKKLKQTQIFERKVSSQMTHFKHNSQSFRVWKC